MLEGLSSDAASVSYCKDILLFPLNHCDIYVSFEFVALSRGYFKTCRDAIWTCFNADLWSLPADRAYWSLRPTFASPLFGLCHIFPLHFHDG